MKLRIHFAFLLALSFCFSAFAQKTTPYLTDPAISPDGREIAFVSGGDIWTVPSEGGTAQLLVAHPAGESRPLYSPDGRRLAFVSTRAGNGDIYILDLETNDLKRLTRNDSSERLDAWSRDGKWIYFSTTSLDISGMNDIFRVSADGGTPMQYSADLYTNEFGASPAPDGSSMAFTARGISWNQWWRNGRSHLDETEIWLRRDGADPTYQQISGRGAKQMWPMWSGDGARLFYVSDRDGTQNIWSQAVGGASERQVTNFKSGRVLWANISYDGKTIVFERNFRIWRLDTGSGRAAEVPITLRGTATGRLTERVRSAPISEFDLSPDGKKVAFIARGEIFAASSKEGGDAAKVTDTAAAESFVAWAGDSTKIVYASERAGDMSLYQYDFPTETETRLTSGNSDALPVFAPDGKSFVFVRNARQLFLYDVEKKQERKLCDFYTDLPPLLGKETLAWSPDGKWIAFLTYAPQNRSYTNVNVVSVENGGASRPISFLANSFSNSISWSPDGEFILFDTAQRTEDGFLARVELKLIAPKFREDGFRDLFKQENPKDKPEPQPSVSPTPAPTPESSPSPSPTEGKKENGKKEEKVKPVEIIFDDIRQRLSILDTGVDVGGQIISPDGKTAVLLASAEGQVNFYAIPLDQLARDTSAKQLTSTPRFKSDAQFSPDSKEIFYLENGRINILDVARRETKSLNLSFEMDVAFSADKMEVFKQGWRYLRDHFYDQNFHGVDWNAVYKTYEPLIAAAKTDDEVDRLMSMMVGELNASHLGVRGSSNDFPATPIGKLGLRFDRAEYEANGRLKITEIIALSPVAITRQVKVGDYLLSVDGASIGKTVNLNELLENKVGKRVVLNFSSKADGSDKREVVVKPVSTGAEKGLLYRQWVENNRAYVARISNGRLGYVHLPDMSSGTLRQLYVDLDVENQGKEGVIIDVRNNNGGFINAYVIDILSRQGYLTFDQRGLWKFPARSSLGQRALERPTILITNQHSLSDAEDFTEGYRTLKLGKVVGEPTAGWIIFTWNSRLFDGTTLRLPRLRVLGHDGKTMELNPRPVDIPVTRPIGESLSGKDSQLDRAAGELLKEIGGGR